VYDHHQPASSSDIIGAPGNVTFIHGAVGSSCTLLVESLISAGVPPPPAPLLTLLALGVHSDTGSLTFDSTTTRDAKALAYSLAAGASQ
jgi:tRNA nucleotidyltransferase (CCA-adding enzyme)